MHTAYSSLSLDSPDEKKSEIAHCHPFFTGRKIIVYLLTYVIEAMKCTVYRARGEV